MYLKFELDLLQIRYWSVKMCEIMALHWYHLAFFLLMHEWHLSHVLKFKIDRWILKKLRLRLPIWKKKFKVVKIGVSRAFFFKITIRLMPVTFCYGWRLERQYLRDKHSLLNRVNWGILMRNILYEKSVHNVFTMRKTSTVQPTWAVTLYDTTIICIVQYSCTYYVQNYTSIAAVIGHYGCLDSCLVTEQKLVLPKAKGVASRTFR